MSRGKYWKADEERELVAAFLASGRNGAQEHAAKHNRPVKGVVAKLRILGYADSGSHLDEKRVDALDGAPPRQA